MKVGELIIFIALGFQYSGQAMPGPVNACTFYKPPFSSKFMACAQPKIRRSACWKQDKIVIKYRGDRSEMYLPDYLIEVTPAFGESLFSNMLPSMKKHLKHSVSHYNSQNPLKIPFADDGGKVQTQLSWRWHVRLLPVPYGGTTMTYPDVKAGGGGLPTPPYCFTAISEYLFDQWYMGFSDMPFAAAWAPLGLPICQGSVASSVYSHLVGGVTKAAKSSASEILPTINQLPFKAIFEKAACAYPAGKKWGLLQNLKPSSDALRFDKLCMVSKNALTSIGNLLPRESEVDAPDEYTSAVKAAWKFSSLVKDIHPGSLSGIEYEDKWQLVYPKSTRNNCFRPGSVNDLPFGPVEFRKPELTTPRSKAGVYVFAIWKKRETHCQEPNSEADLWKLSVQAEHKIIERGCQIQ